MMDDDIRLRAVFLLKTVQECTKVSAFTKQKGLLGGCFLAILENALNTSFHGCRFIFLEKTKYKKSPGFVGSYFFALVRFLQLG